MFGFVFVGMKRESLLKAKSTLSGLSIGEIVDMGVSAKPSAPQSKEAEQLIDYATTPRQKMILAALAETGSCVKAASRLGTTKQTVSRVKVEAESNRDKTKNRAKKSRKGSSGQIKLKDTNSLVFRVMVAATRCVLDDAQITPFSVWPRAQGRETVSKAQVSAALSTLKRDGFLDRDEKFHKAVYRVTDKGYKAVQDYI